MKTSIGTSISLIFTGLALAGSGFANADDGNKSCNVARLHGSYGFSQSGSIVGLAPSPLPAADVGVIHADGRGNLSGHETVNVAGQLFSDTITNGTYTVNADCTGTATWTAVFANGNPSQLRTASFVIVNEFKELHILSTSPGAVLVGVGKRQ